MAEEKVEIVRQCWAGLEESPIDLHLEFFDSEIELRNPSEFPLRGPFRGHDGVRARGPRDLGGVHRSSTRSRRSSR